MEIALKSKQEYEVALPVFQDKSVNKEELNWCKNDKQALNIPKDPRNYMIIHPEGHIDDRPINYDSINHRLEINKDGLLPENNQIMKSFIYDAKIGKTIKNKAKKKISLLRIMKYLQDLKKLDIYFRKPFNEITEQDMQKFILDLEEGRLQYKGRPYNNKTQVGLKKVIKKFYKWLLGENVRYPKIVDWIDTSIETPEYNALRKEQIDTIMTMMTSSTSEKLIRNRAILMVLFDSGVRADELLNVRLKHLTLENDTYKIRVEFSKTKKRTISLPFCKKYIDEWLDFHPNRTEPLAQLFPVKYEHLNMIVKRSGSFIKAKITPHSLRHASATYWCRHLTSYQLCYRFGWAMSSKMPQLYIDREGLNQESAEKIIKQNTMEELRTQNFYLSRRLASIEDTLQRLYGKDEEEAKEIIVLAKQMG